MSKAPGYEPDNPCRYVTPCRRYSVERAGIERFEVIGPDGKTVDWFVTLADAIECAESQAQVNLARACKSKK